MSSDHTPFTATGAPRSGWRVAVLLAVVAFAAGIAVTALFIQQYRHWLPPSAQAMFDPPAPSASAPPSAAFEPPPEAGTAGAALDSDTLSARQVALAAELGALEARTAAINQQARSAAGDAGRAENLLIAFAARRAIDRGLGLGYLDGQLRRRFGATQPDAVRAILRAARQPVTIEDLRLGIDTIAPDLTTGATQDGWWASLQREVAGLIVVHREGTPSPRPAERMTRIRRLLDARQVEAALAEVARLPGAPQAERWMAAASRYVEAHHALDAIETASIMGNGAGG
ncbi:MAG: hypothetical protein B7Y43_00435 [Sphingomonas sp. 28-62-20]|uniref:hypothetical protein n=1 Tax=Sphingomonas sp. 28-62-20 TaxID=1970433 RepID=UPI000BC618C5|nr:MAG: hypothetical protein B7Y43_00435 [Sphingomonas sp. 28-62-20]